MQIKVTMNLLEWPSLLEWPKYGTLIQQTLVRISSSKKFSFIAGGDTNGTTTLENVLEVPCKTKHTLTTLRQKGKGQDSC